MAHDVFISYAAKDKPVADAVCAALERRHIRCWITARDALPGTRYEDSIVAAISKSRLMVLILSSNSDLHLQIMREIDRAKTAGAVVIAFRIENIASSNPFRDYIDRVVDAFAPPLEPHLSELARYIDGLLTVMREPKPSPATVASTSVAQNVPPPPVGEPMPGGAPTPGPTGGPARRGFPIGEVIVGVPVIIVGGLLAGAKSVLRGLLHPRGGARSDTAQAPTARPFEAPASGAARQPYSPGRQESPADHVHFSVTSPPAVKPGSSFVINVWAHLAHQRPDMLQRAQEALGGVHPAVQSKGPARVMRGSVLVVRLRIEELLPESLEDTILWEGEISNATFGVTAPPDLHPGGRGGIVKLYAQGLEIAHIHFAIEVDRAAAQRPDTTITAQAHRTAFASYASEDRDAVLARLQGILKVAPALDVFIDVANMRSGQDWEATLRQEIFVRDVFYLFWSENARKSKVVDWEWRYALRARGLDFIDPVPLAPPDKVPPPPELAAKHFNDWMLAYMRAANQSPPGAPR